jgi:hypothetical protein
MTELGYNSRLWEKKNDFISFSLIYPNATEINFGEIGLFSHTLVSDEKGEYTIYFVNSDNTESKLVTLNYQIEHYLFEMPQNAISSVINRSSMFSNVCSLYFG